MAHYILTGAGFSKNFGGWLTEELWDKLVYHTEIKKNEEIWELLKKNRQNGFETALGEAQQNAEKDNAWCKNYKILQKAIVDIFKDMDKSIENSRLNGSKQLRDPQISYGIERFVAKSDIWFTTNQDVLFEYEMPNTAIPQLLGQQYASRGTPCVQSLQGFQIDIKRDSAIFIDQNTLQRCQEFYLANKQMHRAYIKLHGSFNWRTSDGKELIIIGSNKQEQNIEGSKLLVIGYSFLDIHINKIIFDAVNAENLKLYIWNPASFREISANLKQINQDEYIDCLENGMIWLNNNKLQDFTSYDLTSLEKCFYV